MLEILVELADVTADVLVRLYAEGDDWDMVSVLFCMLSVGRSMFTWDEAEGEPLPAVVDSRAEVTAVLTLGHDILVPLKYRRECV